EARGARSAIEVFMAAFCGARPRLPCRPTALAPACRDVIQRSARGVSAARWEQRLTSICAAQGAREAALRVSIIGFYLLAPVSASSRTWHVKVDGSGDLPTVV